jgi:hypothetical protein
VTTHIRPPACRAQAAFPAQQLEFEFGRPDFADGFAYETFRDLARELQKDPDPRFRWTLHSQTVLGAQRERTAARLRRLIAEIRSRTWDE